MQFFQFSQNFIFFQLFAINKVVHYNGRICGLIRHALDWKVKGSNLIEAKIFLNSNQQKISSGKSEQKEKGTLSLIASVRAIAVGEEEETRRERSGVIIASINLMWWRHLTVFV